MSEKEKSSGKLLEEQLTFHFPHIGKEAPQQVDEATAFCEGYKAFLNEGKTERECVEAAVKRLEAAGYHHDHLWPETGEGGGTHQRCPH